MLDLNTPDNCLFFYRVRQVLLRILTVYCKLANFMAMLNILQKSEHCTFSRMMPLFIQEKVVVNGMIKWLVIKKMSYFIPLFLHLS
jgi:hypothetical protein